MWDGGSIDCSLRERALPRDGVTVKRQDPLVPRVGYLSLHPSPASPGRMASSQNLDGGRQWKFSLPGVPKPHISCMWCPHLEGGPYRVPQSGVGAGSGG